MPKIFIFGATGTGGKALCKFLQTKDVTVICASRDPTKATPFKNVKWIRANPVQKQTYLQHLKGSDLVVGIFGSQDKKNVNIYSKGYAAIISAMQQANVKRLIAVTASHDHPEAPFFFKHVIRPTFLEQTFQDMMIFDEMLKKYKGPIVYTNLRPSRFVQGKKKKYKMVQSYTKQSTGWDFEIHIDSLAQAIYTVWEKDMYANKFVDLGHY